MEFPPFEEFLATLDEDTIAGIMKDANIAAKTAGKVPLTYDADRPAAQVLAISYQTALEVLAVYHKWLEQYL